MRGSKTIISSKLFKNNPQGLRAKIGGVLGEEIFCPRAIRKIASQFCVNQCLDFVQNEFGHRPAKTFN